MPIELLREIQQSVLPLLLTDSAAVHQARMLRASGLIEADITEACDPLQQADIRAITNLGLIAALIGENPNES